MDSWDSSFVLGLGVEVSVQGTTSSSSSSSLSAAVTIIKLREYQASRTGEEGIASRTGRV